MTPAVVIATRNRPDSLLKTVESLVQQTVLPAELSIVDSSEDTPARERIEAICAEASIALDYHHPAPRGSCHQRNVGIDRTTGDPIVFLDDDVWLSPDCIENLLVEYERRPDLGGVAGSDVDPPPPGRLSVLWRRFFGLSTWTPTGSGRMKAGFYVDGITRSAEVKEVEYMNGWLMSYRRHALDDERFDEALPGYAQKEDVDLAYRVSRRYPLVKTPSATGHHFRISTSRLSPHELVKVIIGNQLYLHRKNMPRTARHRVALWWALLGFALLNIGKGMAQRKPGFVTGVFAGILTQARGRRVVDQVART